MFPQVNPSRAFPKMDERDRNRDLAWAPVDLRKRHLGHNVLMRHKRPNKLSPYPGIEKHLDLEASRNLVKRNDLLPPRPDDKAGGQVAEQFVESLKRSLLMGEYEPERAVVIPVAKRRYSTRPAALLNLADRVVYHALVEPLRPRIKKGLVSDRVLLWPRDEQTDKRWSQFEALPLDVGSAYVVVADVSGFYESVDHGLLHQALVTLTGKVEIIDALMDFLGRVMAAPRGLPQGLDTSDVLATAYLTCVDSEVLRRIPRYWRHGDDIRMAVSSHDEGRRAVHYLEEQLRAVRLLLNAEKTQVMHRETYSDQLQALGERKSRIREKLRVEREKDDDDPFAGDNGIFLRRWDDIYGDSSVDLEDLSEQIRASIEPEEVNVAVVAFEEAISKMPGSGTEDAMRDEEFHGVFMYSLAVLRAVKHPLPVESAPRVIGLFPDKTAVLAGYLRSVAASHPRKVSRAAIAVLQSAYLTGWQKAWLLGVLHEVAAVGDFADHMAASEIAMKVAEGEDESWLARVEAVRVLAEFEDLDHGLFLRVWNRAPAPLRVDLAAAVAVAASFPEMDWAVAFCESLNAEALMQVVLHGIRQEMGSHEE